MEPQINKKHQSNIVANATTVSTVCLILMQPVANTLKLHSRLLL